jgi:hypothetical protein
MAAWFEELGIYSYMRPAIEAPTVGEKVEPEQTANAPGTEVNCPIDNRHAMEEDTVVDRSRSIGPDCELADVAQ